MNTTDVEGMWSTWRPEERKINDTIEKAKAEKVKAEADLKELEENVLSNLLAEFVLRGSEKVEAVKPKKKRDDAKEIAADYDLAQARKRRDELNRIISDYPLLKKGLDRVLAKHRSEGRKIEHLERRVSHYEQIKADLRKRSSASSEKDLLEWAKVLDCLDDAEAFLKSLRKS